MTCDVMRAPLVPSGSLTTWTRTSCPSFSRSSILGWARARGSRRARRPLPRGLDRLGATRLGCLVLFVRPLRAVRILDRVEDLRDVQERVALEADVDERRLHAGQHLRDPALVDVADDAALALPLDEDLGHQVVLENGHHGLVAARGDDHLLGHA